jgi:hypothetical protein
MLRAFCIWRSKRCARAAIRAMHHFDYADVKWWLRKAAKWEGRANAAR